MHMCSMAVIGANKPKNLVHIVINNGAHETVGGMPTVANSADLVGIALVCGFSNEISVDEVETLDCELNKTKEMDELTFIEVKCSIGSRADLDRPIDNKKNFMGYLKSL